MADQPTPTGSGGAPPDSAADHAQQQASAVAETGKQQAGHVVAEAKAQTSQLLDDARGQARDRVDTQVSQLAGVLDTVSGELEQMADGSANAESSYLIALARDGSTTARRLSQRLNDGGLDGAIDDVRRFARQRPAAFLAGAFGVGLLLGRVTRNADLGEIMSSDSDAPEQSSGDSASSSSGRDVGDGRLGGGAERLEPLDAVPTGTEPATPVQPTIPGEPELIPPPTGGDAMTTGRQP